MVVTTLLFLVLCALVLRSLGAPAGRRRARGTADSWSELSHRLAGDVLSGVRTLSRLAAARRDRLGRPWW